MPIPGADSAFIEPQKLIDYLLNVEHSVGGSKARWFLSAGYDPREPDRLESDLLGIVHRSEDFVEHRGEEGIKYVVRGAIETPRRGRADLLTVWVVEPESPGPRFVTAYPQRRRLHGRA